jgi:hypothetical protein
LLAFAILIAVPAAFSAEKELPPSADRKVDFQSDIKPLFESRCTMCHGAQQQLSGLRLDRRDDALKGGYSGVVIQPGSSARSRLVRLVSGAVEKLVMPPVGAPLSKEEIGLLRAWIDQGAEWPLAANLEHKEEPARSRSDHWAFQPIQRPAPPAVRERDWARNEIDRFILAKLEEKGIEPSVEANKATLIRRLSLDLIGLPPTPAEVEAFLAADDSSAYEELVDRLMRSPHYGERWARYWLDLARYADSDGYRGDAFRPHAWRYRHWVIEAINRDMPFDQFTIEQIAGDLLPGATIEQRVATGFHRNTLTNREGGIDPEQFRVEQVYDRNSTLGTVWLGLTVGCAQCHDHKYDPLTQKEFYQLYAFFNTADELNIDAPLPGEIGPYLEKRPEYLKRRRALLEQYNIPGFMPVWEERLLQAAANPGKWPDWDISFDDLRTMLDHGERIVRTVPEKRTWKEQKSLTDYFVDNYQRVVSKDRAKELGFDELSRKLKELDDSFPALSQAPVIAQSSVDRQAHLHVRGQYKDKGIAVTPRTPAVLPPLEVENPTRLDLARWLVSGRNPLPPRVMVNRFWQELFGRGLVASSDNFGSQGEKPSHPELLDWLADEFIANGWSMKGIIKKMVLSAAYRQSAASRPDLLEIDSDNSLIARQRRLRLSAEQIRDSALLASGLLYPEIGGESVFPPQPEGAQRIGSGPKWVASEGKDRYRRGLYIVFQRMSPYPLMTNFDAPSGYGPACRRERSNTPLQALNLLNDPLFAEAAQALAMRVLTESRSAEFKDRLDFAFLLCLGRRAEPDEREYWLKSLDQQAQLLKSDPEAAAKLAPVEIEGVSQAEAAAWVTAGSVLLNLDEFITRE